MSNIRWVILGIVSTVGVACLWGFSTPAPAQDKAKAVSKWEYKILAMDSGTLKKTEEDINKLGAEGYKVISISSASTGGGIGVTATTTVVLERAK